MCVICVLCLYVVGCACAGFFFSKIFQGGQTNVSRNRGGGGIGWN